MMMDVIMVIGIALAIALAVGFLVWAIFGKNPFKKKQANQIPVPTTTTVLKRLGLRWWPLLIFVVLPFISIGLVVIYNFAVPLFDRPSMSVDEVCSVVSYNLNQHLPYYLNADEVEIASSDAHYEGNGKWTVAINARLVRIRLSENGVKYRMVGDKCGLEIIFLERTQTFTVKNTINDWYW